jgi:pimeloyl-ACP methyl ester carboxylesterase
MRVSSARLDARTRAATGGTYCDLSDGVTHYCLSGPANGPAVVLVHGGTVPLWIWDSLAGRLSSDGFRVLRYDHFGRGYSDRPKVAYNRALYERQLHELVDHLAFDEPFDLVGLSMGGAMAVNYTAHHPARVRRLVLIAPVVNHFKVPRILRMPVVGELILRLVGLRFMRRRFAELAESLPDFEGVQRQFMEQTTYKGFHRAFLSMLRSDTLGNYDAAYRTVGAQDRDILLIWGERDVEITADMIANARRFIPRLHFKPVSDAGHGVVLEKPERVNEIVLEFLQGKPTAEMDASGCGIGARK